MRQEHDHYGTPSWCLDALYQSGCCPAQGARIIEPCAGTSRIATPLRRRGHEVVTSDLVPPPPSLVPWPALDAVQDLTRPDTLQKLLGLGPFDWVVTNPPYQILGQILPVLLGLAPRGALLCRLSILERAASRAALLDRLTDVVILGRVRWLAADGSQIKGTDSVASVWVVWGEGVGNNAPQIRWLEREEVEGRG